MKMGFSFSCAIILRIDSASDSRRDYAAGLQSAADKTGIPLIWNIPDTLAGAAGISSFISSGRAGIPHPLLTEAEIETEIHINHADNHGDSLPWLFPRIPDLCRRSVREIYNKRSRILLLHRNTLGIYGGRENTRLPLLELNGESLEIWEKPVLKQQLKELRRRTRQEEGPAVILVSNLQADRAEDILRLISLTTASLRVQLLEQSKLLDTEETGDVELPGAFPVRITSTGFSWDPVSRQKRIIPWESPEDVRIKLLAGADPLNPHVENEMEGIHRDLIANMPGEVYMYEGDTGAVFNKGDLASLYTDKKRPQVNGPAKAFIHCSSGQQPAHRLCSVRRIGTFSFDDYPARGLRDTLTFNSPAFSSPARITRDFFFVSGDTRLCVSFFIEYPRIEDPDIVIDSFGFMEIPLAKPAGGTSYSAETLYPDGEKGNCRFTEPGEYLLTGSRFRFPAAGGSFSLSYSENNQSLQELQVSLRSGRLYLNPWGSYAPIAGRTLSGIKEQFSIVLDVEERKEISLSSLKPYIEPHRIFSGTLQPHKQ